MMFCPLSRNLTLRANIKVLSRYTTDGLSILGIETDNPLIANLILNQGNPKKQLESISDAYIQAEYDLSILISTLSIL